MAVLTGEAGSSVGALKEPMHPLCPVFLLDVDQGLEFAQVMSVAGPVAYALEREVGGVIVMDDDALDLHSAHLGRDFSVISVWISEALTVG